MILMESALSWFVLCLGARAKTPVCWAMSSDASDYLREVPWMRTSHGLPLALTVPGASFLWGR